MSFIDTFIIKYFGSKFVYRFFCLHLAGLPVYPPNLIYEGVLYGLTEEEIKIVEGK
jgi:hypothetical protein